jgi:phage-related tail protein
MTAPLPSQQSARTLVQGEPLALLPVLAHAAGRGALIFVGALIAGAKPETAARAAIGGALTIEAFVLLYELKGQTS